MRVRTLTAACANVELPASDYVETRSQSSATASLLVNAPPSVRGRAWPSADGIDRKRRRPAHGWAQRHWRTIVGRLDELKVVEDPVQEPSTDENNSALP